MTQKEKLATEYIKLRRQFEGEDFKENVVGNQIWYLTKNFRVIDLKEKIAVVKSAIEDKEIRLRNEAYYATPEGQAYKKNIEDCIETYRGTWKEIHDTFQNWIINKVNELIPGNWTAELHIGTYMSANVKIGLVNRNPKHDCSIEFGHDFSIYFDGYYSENKTPQFEINYGTLGSFDAFNDDTRPIYLSGLATISNDKEFLRLLMDKFTEKCSDIHNISEQINILTKKLSNPFDKN